MTHIPPKPRSEVIDAPIITRLPRLHFGRQAARRFLWLFIQLLVWIFIDLQVNGLENFPRQGPVLIVSNHLGDADVIVGVAIAPRFIEVMSKAELRAIPIVGWLMDIYGVIWVHRGQPDRRALRAALDGLAEGRPVTLAPEGRESVTGSLEQGTHGAAYLAIKSGAPILPVTLTGAENQRLYGNMKRLRRTSITVTIGPIFQLKENDDRHIALERGTQRIMQTLAHQLPPEYQGVYRIQ